MRKVSVINSHNGNSNPGNSAMSAKVRIIRMKELVKKTGLSRSALYDMMRPDSTCHDAMPPKIWLFGTPGKGPVGYLESDVDAFILALAAKSGVIHDRVQTQQVMGVAA